MPRRIRSTDQRNTNILMIKFGALSKPCKVHTGDPVVCSNDQCAAVLSHLSKISSEDEGVKKVYIYIYIYIILAFKIIL